MTLRSVAAAAACIGALVLTNLVPSWADGMPEPEDMNYNPVPSKPGVPAPGVTQPPPVTQPKPAPATPAVEQPKPEAPPAAAPAPMPAPAPAPVEPPKPTPTPAPATTPAAQKKPIYEVISIDVQIQERQPPVGAISVKGSARTGGWTNIELKPLQTFAPEVGMRSYTLVGTPPSGMATQALTPVTATIKLDPLPADVKTIRVLGETNEVAQTFR